jgi:transcriptional regulator with XRE-family HTH domain
MENGKPWRRTFIKEWREFRGMTQTELGEAIERSGATISQLENQQSPYRQATLEAIARALGCTTGDLLHRAPQASEALHDILRYLTEEQRAEAIEHIMIIRRRQ